MSRGSPSAAKMSGGMGSSAHAASPVVAGKPARQVLREAVVVAVPEPVVLGVGGVGVDDLLRLEAEATFAFQAFRQSRLNLSDVSGLSDMAHSRSKASGNSPLRNSSNPPLPFSSNPSAGFGSQEMGCLSTQGVYRMNNL